MEGCLNQLLKNLWARKKRQNNVGEKKVNGGSRGSKHRTHSKNQIVGAPGGTSFTGVRVVVGRTEGREGREVGSLGK